MASYETRLLFSESSQNISANTSVVTVTFQFRRTDYAHYSWSGNGSAYWNISCAGQNPGNTYFTFQYNMNANVWQTVATRSFTVTHNSNGALTVAASAKIYFGDGILPGTLTASGNFTCAVIPRYTTITTWKNTSVNQISANFSWACSDNVKAIQISLNGGSWTAKWSGNAKKSGTFTQTGLKPNTAYKLKIRAQRSDSSLWTSSSNISFTTKPIASVSNTSLDMNIGEDLTLTFNNHANNASYLKLEVLDENGKYVQMASVTGIQAASYTWNLSAIAEQLYKKCPARNTMPYRIICGVTLGGVDYTGTKTGNMMVINSAPTFSSYTHGNTVTDIISLLGTVHMPENYGNMQVVITPENKAAAQNAASISKYVCEVSCGSFHKSFEQAFSEAAVTIDLGAFAAAGTYTLNVYAVDSRGNNSAKAAKTFHVIPYHKPILDMINIKRLNDFEAQTSLSLTGYYSKLTVGNTQKNTNLTLGYRYCEVGAKLPPAYTALPIAFSDFNNDDKKAVYNNADFLTLDSSKSYNIEFAISDNLYTNTFTVTVSTGIAPMYIFEDGLVTIDKAPDFSNTDARLQVGGDISGEDSYGNTRNLFGILHHFLCDSEAEPSDQIIGGAWLRDSN